MTRLLDTLCLAAALALALSIGLPLAWEVDRRLAPVIEWLPEPEPMRGVGV